MESLLPTGYRWLWTAAVREKKRDRPWGGELIGIRNELKCVNYREDQVNCCNGVDIIINGDTFSFTIIYNRYGMKKLRKVLEPKLKENRSKKHILLGDWNARLGPLGSKSKGMYVMLERESQDTVYNAEGEALDELLTENGCKTEKNKEIGRAKSPTYTYGSSKSVNKYFLIIFPWS